MLIIINFLGIDIVNFPKGSKNEAIVHQYNAATKELDQLRIIKGASNVALYLVLKARDSGKAFDYTYFRESSKKYSNSLDTLESNLKVISDLKGQFAKKRNFNK